MSKFKIGDKVRCVEANQGHWIEVGEIYTVKCVDREYIHLEEITEKHNYYESRFELVSEKPNYREMKPTDMVKVCIGDSEFEVPLGDIDYFFQLHHDKQKQKEDLSNLILSKQKELSQLIDKLNQM